MTIRLFDVQAGFGGAKLGEKEFVSADSWRAEMDRLEVDRALVRLSPEDLDRDITRGNDLILEACRNEPRFAPCLTMAPSTDGDLPAEVEQVEALAACGAGAAWLRPSHDGWSLREWGSGPLMEALVDRQMPTYFLERMIGLEALADLAGRYPKLPFILAEVGYRSQRVLLPLLKACGNVHLSIGSNYTVHGGIEQIVRAVGPERLLFGSGFPQADPMMAVTQLMYADLSDEHKAMIGAGNLERMIEEVRR